MIENEREESDKEEVEEGRLDEIVEGKRERGNEKDKDWERGGRMKSAQGSYFIMEVRRL